MNKMLTVAVIRLAKGRGGVIHVTSDNKLYSSSDFQIHPHEFDKLIIHGQIWKVMSLEILDI